MPQVDLVVIGASAGGLQALIEIVQHLPASIRTPILIAVHTKGERNSFLPAILSRRSELPVEFAADGGAIEEGHIYVAPPDVHLLVTRNRMLLSRGPRENGFRPGIDPLFRTAARAYTNALMGIILSGGLDDGSYGLRVLKDSGGIAVVQDPNEAVVPAMPLNALHAVDADYVLPARQIAALIAEQCAVSSGGRRTMSPKQEPDPQNPADETDVEDMEETFGPPSGLTCPDCGGALWELHNGALMRFRCHVGHQFTTEALDAAQQDGVEGALWAAVRVLEEHAELQRRIAERTGSAGLDAVSSGFAERALDSQRQAHTIRELLLSRVVTTSPLEGAKSRGLTKRATNRRERGNGRGRTTRRAR